MTLCVFAGYPVAFEFFARKSLIKLDLKRPVRNGYFFLACNCVWMCVKLFIYVICILCKVSLTPCHVLEPTVPLKSKLSPWCETQMVSRAAGIA